MKFQTLLYLLCLLGSFSLKAQSGTISYDIKMDIHRRIKDEAMRERIPQFQTSKMELLYTPTETLFQRTIVDEGGDQPGNGNGEFRFRAMRPESILYTNLQANERVEQTDFFGKKYLITDSISQAPWKVSSEMKMILGMPCMKASYAIDTSRTVEAWFTAAIPVSSGPQNFGQLPGMILELNMNKGEIIMLATAIDQEKTVSIKKPTAGKKTTREEYTEMVKKTMEEMRKNSPGGGRIFIGGGQ